MLLSQTSYTLAILLTLINALWLFTILFGMPGTWLMVLSTAVVAWLEWEPGRPAADQPISIWTLLALVCLAFIGEILEFIAGAAGAKKAGGSPRSALAAIFGGVIGAIVGTFVIPIPLLGSLIGAAAGAGIGAASIELASGRPMELSIRVGMGAGVGRLLGTIYKLIVGAVIWITATLAAFF